MIIKEFITINHIQIEPETIIHYPEVSDLCYRSYPNHPNGCINIEKCNNLNVPYFGTILKHSQDSYFYLVYIDFDFKRYKEMRKLYNPDFFNSEGRINCNRYYQNSIKKSIKEFLECLNKTNESFYVFGCGSGFKLSFQKPVASMEKVCINVFSTLRRNDIPFEIKPINRIVFCNLLISKKEIKFNRKIKQKSILEY